MGVGVNYHGEWRGMQGERIGVGVKCQGNAGECQGNVRYWVQSARGMQGSVCVGAKSPRMQGNAQEYQGNVNGWVQCAREI